MTELRKIEGGKREPCPYCGNQPHEAPLACPRIEHVTLYDDGTSMDIYFWHHDETPQDPEAA